MIKYFRFSWDHVMWEISYPNLLMLLATIPKYKTDKKKKGNESDMDDDEIEVIDDVQDLEDFINSN